MLKRWVFVPPSWEYGFPWVLGAILSFVLGLFGLPTLRKFEANLPEGGWMWLIVLGMLALNALSLWAHLRTQFLTVETAWRKLTGTYVVMTVFFIVLFGLVSMARGEIRFTLRDASLDDTAHVSVVALTAIALSWFITAAPFLKTEEPGVGSVRQKRRNSLALLRELLDGRTTPMDTLVRTLKGLADDAASVAETVSENLDRQLAESWAEAATTLHALLQGWSSKDFRDHRADIEPDVRENMKPLEWSYPR